MEKGSEKGISEAACGRGLPQKASLTLCVAPKELGEVSRISPLQVIDREPEAVMRALQG